MSLCSLLNLGASRRHLTWLGSILAALLLTTAHSVHAQTFARWPASAAFGELQMGVFPQAHLNRQPITLGPGTRILDENNRLVLPATLTQPRMVAYTRGALGEVQRIWLLTPTEQATVRITTAKPTGTMRPTTP